MEKQNIVYVLGGAQTMDMIVTGHSFDEEVAPMDVLMFETTNQLWTRCNAVHTPGSRRFGHSSVLLNDIIYVYGAYAPGSDVPAMNCLDTVKLEWLQTPKSKSDKAPEMQHNTISLHSAVRWREHMVVIGGQQSYTSVNTTRLFTPSTKGNCSGHWQRLQCTGDVPEEGIIGHTSVATGNDVYIYGGGFVRRSDTQQQVFHLHRAGPFWRLTLTDNVTHIDCHWKRLRLEHLDHDWPAPRFSHASALVGDKLVIIGGCTFDDNCTFPTATGKTFVVFPNCCTRKGPFQPRILSVKLVSAFDISIPLEKWVTLEMSVNFQSTSGSSAAHTAIALDDQVFIQGGLHNYTTDDLILRLHRLASGVREDFVAKVGCPAGTASSSFLEEPCKLCPVTHYSFIAGSANCTPCPPNTKSKKQQSTSIDNCLHCVPGTCGKGSRSCAVDRDAGFAISCSCSFGYIELDQCNTPVYYIVIFCAVALVAVLVPCIVYFLRKKFVNMEKLARTDQQNLQKQLERVKDIWRIDYDDLHQREKIGSGCFGDVFRGTYNRDLEVAI